MIGANLSFHNDDVMGFADAPDEGAQPLGHLINQDLLSVFHYQNDPQLNAMLRVGQDFELAHPFIVAFPAETLHI